MLTAKQLWFPLNCYKICSILGFLPFTFNTKEGKIQQEKSSRRIQFWWFCMICVGFRSLLGAGFLFNSLYGEEKVRLAFIPLLLLLAGSGFAGFYIFCTVLIQHARTTVIIFNKLCEGAQNRKPWRKLTLQEWVVLCIPVNIILIPLVIGIDLYFSPDAPFNIAAYLSPSSRNGWTLLAIYTFDVFIAFYLSSMTLLTTHTALLFFQKCTEEMQLISKLIGNAERARGQRCYFIMSEAVDNLRQLQLLVQAYNGGYKMFNFFAKLFSLSVFIVYISFGVFILHTDLEFGIQYLFFGPDCAVVYCIMFQKAFSVPRMIRKLKSKIVNLSKTQVWHPNEKRELIGRIKSIPPVGIRVGNFHSFERMSTPNFLAFASKNIVRILIALSKS